MATTKKTNTKSQTGKQSTAKKTTSSAPKTQTTKNIVTAAKSSTVKNESPSKPVVKKLVKSNPDAKISIKGLGNKSKESDGIVDKIVLQYPFVGRFEKVSYDTFKKSAYALYNISSEQASDKEIEKIIREMYDGISIPKRLSNGSSEYHFSFPYSDVDIAPGQVINIPTGIKCYLARNWMLKIYPEEFAHPNMSFGFLVDNNVKIVNPDQYYLTDDSGAVIEGQIYIKMVNNNHDGNTISLSHGSIYAKGVFEMYGLAHNETDTE